MKPENYTYRRFLRVALFSLVILPLMARGQTKIRVSPSGDDTAAGTEQAPVATVHMALRKARELRRLADPAIKEGIQIIVDDGTYVFDKPVTIRPEDSGTPESPTSIVARSGTSPVFSGGVQVNGWQKASGKIKGIPETIRKELWVADIPVVGGQQLQFRQMRVNGRKAARANNFHPTDLDRILSVDKDKQEMWIPTPREEFADTEGLEFVIHQWWAIANLRVKSLETFGDSTRVRFHQPESRIEFEHPWPPPFIDAEKEYNGNSAFFFTNTPELLDEPGEWHADPRAGKIYYLPRKGEDLNTARVIVPFLETLLQIEGNRDSPVKHLEFKGIGFEHTTWLRPAHSGHVPLQAGWYITDAYKLDKPGTPDKQSLENQAWIGRQPAGIEVKNANHITFERCSFKHMAATGLDLIYGVNNCRVGGNVFRDIGGTGIQAGFFGGPDFEAHLPYEPSDRRELVHHIEIDNNLITDVTNEDWGCVGISIGYAHDVNIEHNEISDVNYSGICVGWGWTKTVNASKNNRVHANKIHRFAKQMYDVGGVYTLSAQPNTEISENVIYDLMDAPYAHMPDHYQYIYLDEGSSYIRILNNWTEKDKFFSNTPGPGNEWENNGPQVSDEIKNKAGIQPEFRDILKE